MWLYILTAIGSGSLIAFQAGANKTLLSYVGNPLWTTTILFGIGFIFLLVVTFCSSMEFPPIKQLGLAPYWSYGGGIIVASYLLSITFLVPRIGLSMALFLVIAGQILGALLIEHWGLIGVAKQPINISKALGVLMMVIGIYLAKK